MERERIFYISQKYQTNQYRMLDLTIDSPKEIWKQAVDMLQDRINGRYFEPIQLLINDGEKGEKDTGFAAMSLLCLLIDTFWQFEYAEPNYSSRKWDYIEFMNRFLRIERNLAKKFYTDIRCGLLHSAETLNGSYLTFDYLDSRLCMDIVKKDGMDVLAVNIKDLNDILKRYFDRYWHSVLELSNNRYRTRRQNFILKMDYITLKNETIKADLKERRSREGREIYHHTIGR